MKGRTFTRHLSFPAVTGAETSLEIIVPVPCVLVGVLWNIAAVVTGAAANRGFAVLSNTAALTQCFGSTFQGVTEGAFSGIIIGDQDTAAVTNSNYVTATVFHPVGESFSSGQRFFGVLSSEAAGMTVSCEAFLQFVTG